MANLIVLAAVLCASTSMCSALNAQQNTSSNPRALPNVTTVMEGARATLRAASKDGSNLQAQVAERQRAARKLLTQHKSQYEDMIRDQSRVNQDAWEKNQMMRRKLNASYGRLAPLRRQFQALKNSSSIMREAMAQLLPKVKVASRFLDQVNDEVAPLLPSELDTIRPTTPEPTLAYYLDKERSHAGLATSLLQLGSKQGAPTPEGDVSNMSHGQELPAAMLDTLSRLAEANQHAEDMLLSRFEVVIKDKTQRHARQLIDTQRMNESLIASEATAVALTDAQKYLQGVNTNLHSRLQGIQTFYTQVRAAMTRSLDEADAASSTVHA